MWRTSWSQEIERLDPERDALQVHQLVCASEFPWDTLQALSFALFRTYAVPSIGALLDRTGELTGRTQQRYEDTGLLLDAVLEHGTDSEPGRRALRRVNAMHAAYDISNEDMRYVLSTFVVMPVRWNAAYGWRPFTELEQRAGVAYHRELGRRMGIRDLPETWQGWERLLGGLRVRARVVRWLPGSAGRCSSARSRWCAAIPTATTSAGSARSPGAARRRSGSGRRERPSYAPAVICDACRESEHERCPGGSWCDCQHRPPGPVEPVTGPPGE